MDQYALDQHQVPTARRHEIQQWYLMALQGLFSFGAPAAPPDQARLRYCALCNSNAVNIRSARIQSS